MSPWGKPLVSLMSCAAETAPQFPGASADEGEAEDIGRASFKPVLALPPRFATWTVSPPSGRATAAPTAEISVLVGRQAGALVDVESEGLAGDASGAFVLEPNAFGGQPCFRRADGGLWLYYLESKKQWQVASDLGSEACIIYKPCDTPPSTYSIPSSAVKFSESTLFAIEKY